MADAILPNDLYNFVIILLYLRGLRSATLPSHFPNLAIVSTTFAEFNLIVCLHRLMWCFDVFNEILNPHFTFY